MWLELVLHVGPAVSIALPAGTVILTAQIAFVDIILLEVHAHNAAVAAYSAMVRISAYNVQLELI